MAIPSKDFSAEYLKVMMTPGQDNNRVKWMSRVKPLSETDRMQMHNWLSFMRRDKCGGPDNSPFSKRYTNKSATTHLWE